MSYKGTPLSSQIIWLEQRVKQLESGPGGIMELKQTIADKEKRIEKLEAALREIAGNGNATNCDPQIACDKARKALEGKVPLEWTEYYGQGSEPWLNKE